MKERVCVNRQYYYRVPAWYRTHPQLKNPDGLAQGAGLCTVSNGLLWDVGAQRFPHQPTRMIIFFRVSRGGAGSLVRGGRGTPKTPEKENDGWERDAWWVRWSGYCSQT